MADRREPWQVPKPDPQTLAGAWGMCRAMLRTGERRGQGYSRRACGKPTVASILRGSRRPQRWGYCAVHLAGYGRVVREGEVWWDPLEARQLSGREAP